MLAYMEHEQAQLRKRYLSSARHTMQVDFELFLAELAKESKRGRKRAARSGKQRPLQAKARHKAELKLTKKSQSASTRKQKARTPA